MTEGTDVQYVVQDNIVHVDTMTSQALQYTTAAKSMYICAAASFPVSKCLNLVCLVSLGLRTHIITVHHYSFTIIVRP